MIGDVDKLPDYLNAQLEIRGWSKSELARRAGVSRTQTIDVLNSRANPGADFCISVARALGDPPEELLRMAGILPQLPPAVAEERAALDVFRRLSGQIRRAMLATMRNLAGIRTPTATIRDPVATYDTEPRTLAERLAWRLEHEAGKMPLEDQQALWEFMDRLEDRRGEGNGAPGHVLDPET